MAMELDTTISHVCDRFFFFWQMPKQLYCLLQKQCIQKTTTCRHSNSKLSKLQV